MYRPGIYRAALMFIALGVLSTACVDERAFYISRNLSPCNPIPGAEDGLGSGVLDLQGQKGYVFFPEIVSELAQTAGLDGEPERNRLMLRGFEVKVDLGQAGKNLGIEPVLVSQEVPSFATIEPGGRIQTAITVITEDLVKRLKGLPLDRKPWALIKIRAVADHNGATLKSLELDFPIQLCNGCLMSGVNPGGPLPDCPATKATQVSSNACGLPQDSEVFCCNPSAPRCFSSDDLAALPDANNG